MTMNTKINIIKSAFKNCMQMSEILEHEDSTIEAKKLRNDYFASALAFQSVLELLERNDASLITRFIVNP